MHWCGTFIPSTRRQQNHLTSQPPSILQSGGVLIPYRTAYIISSHVSLQYDIARHLFPHQLFYYLSLAKHTVGHPLCALPVTRLEVILCDDVVGFFAVLLNLDLHLDALFVWHCETGLGIVALGAGHLIDLAGDARVDVWAVRGNSVDKRQRGSKGGGGRGHHERKAEPKTIVPGLLTFLAGCAMTVAVLKLGGIKV